MDRKKLERRLERLKDMRDKLQAQHKDNEPRYTYHGGFDLGYLKGKICILEEILDEMDDDLNKIKNGTD